jgi:hypothetical protein
MQTPSAHSCRVHRFLGQVFLPLTVLCFAVLVAGQLIPSWRGTTDLTTVVINAVQLCGLLVVCLRRGPEAGRSTHLAI